MKKSFNVLAAWLGACFGAREKTFASKGLGTSGETKSTERKEGAKGAAVNVFTLRICLYVSSLTILTQSMPLLQQPMGVTILCFVQSLLFLEIISGSIKFFRNM